MPELPEVETVVRDLRPLVVGRTLTAVRTGTRGLRRPWKPEWCAPLTGATVGGVNRRGKWIVVTTDRPQVLIVHLGMTGQFTAVPASTPAPDHLHLWFELDGGAHEWRMRDPRRFGSADLFADATVADAFLAERLGPEPFDLPPEVFRASLARTTRPVKAVLLDQAVVAGVGNIYADEALHRAGLHPETRANAVPPAAADRLCAAVAAILTTAIEKRGSTIRDYVGGSGLAGGFQHEHRVYGRGGAACGCGEVIAVLRVGGRSSHFCPSCQPAGGPS